MPSTPPSSLSTTLATQTQTTPVCSLAIPARRLAANSNDRHWHLLSAQPLICQPFVALDTALTMPSGQPSLARCCRHPALPSATTLIISSWSNRLSGDSRLLGERPRCSWHAGEPLVKHWRSCHAQSGGRLADQHPSIAIALFPVDLQLA